MKGENIVDDYKPNSHKSKEQNTPPSDKKIEKIVSGAVKSKKKSEIGKLADIFISEDVNNVKSYILMGVLVPAIKKAISDIVTNGIDMILYGETEKTKKNSAASKVSYRSYYEKENDSRKDYNPLNTKSGYSYDDIILDDRGEAIEVLSRMNELIDTYQMVSVADLYELVGLTGNYTDNKYGWTDISSASVVRVREGYAIKLPRALPLN